jgi:hypothetical protein
MLLMCSAALLLLAVPLTLAITVLAAHLIVGLDWPAGPPQPWRPTLGSARGGRIVSTEPEDTAKSPPCYPGARPRTQRQSRTAVEIGTFDLCADKAGRYTYKR